MAQLIDRANSWAGVLKEGGSVRFMMANATVSLEGMLAAYPGPLSLVTVQVHLSINSFGIVHCDLRGCLSRTCA